jgi:cell division septal protein FtsQ
MEIKTNRPREAQDARIVPPPDTTRRARRKTTQKIGKNHVAGRRFVSFLKTLGKAFVFFLTAIFMVSAMVYVYNSEKFNLRKVTFYGCRELDQKELEEVIRQNFPRNILRIDLRQLKNRLEKETWARRVEIRRVLPSDLVVYVEERTPSVILEIQGELMMADRDGTVLDRYDPKYGKLDMPVFKGVLGEDAESYRLYQEENAARIHQGLEMLADIESGSPSYARRISEVDISDRKNLKVLLVDDTAEVYLGDKDYLKRFRTLMENLSQYQELKNQYAEFSSIDMRFEGNIIYRPITANAEHGSRTQKLQGSKVKSE